MSNFKEIWVDYDGYIQILHLLRVNRAKLGLSNNECMVLIDYVAEWLHTETTNPYPKLMEYSGLGQRALQKIITSIENKGLLKRVIISEPALGKTGVKFNLSPLLIKLRTLDKGSERFDGTLKVESFANSTTLLDITEVTNNVKQ